MNNDMRPEDYLAANANDLAKRVKALEDGHHWKAGTAWAKLREDVNLLAWLLAEEKYQPPLAYDAYNVEDWHGKACAYPTHSETPPL